MVGQEVLLVDVERTDVARDDDRPGTENVGLHLIAHHQVPVVLEGDEAAIEEVVYMRGQQEPVAPVELLLVGGVFPRLDMTRAEVMKLLDARNPTCVLVQANVVLEEPLTNSGVG